MRASSGSSREVRTSFWTLTRAQHPSCGGGKFPFHPSSTKEETGIQSREVSSLLSYSDMVNKKGMGERMGQVVYR